MKIYFTIGCVEDDDITETVIVSIDQASAVLDRLMDDADVPDELITAIDKVVGDTKIKAQ